MNLRQPAGLRLQRLMLPDGGYAMVALDQRESLRAMFAAARDGAQVSDAELTAFKTTGVGALSPFASGLLLDREYGFENFERPRLAGSCGLIVAADLLHQRSGRPVTRTSVDEAVTIDFLKDSNAAGVKFLVLWQRSGDPSDRERMVTKILELANSASVASVIEVIVRPEGDQWASAEEKKDSIFSAAEEICALEPDLFKAEVPGYVEGDVSGVAAAAEQMSSITQGDWVVLSNGVRPGDFAAALSEAVRGGAKGFLAGRAIWADIVGRSEQRMAFIDVALPRLRNLRAIVTERPVRP